MQRRLRVLFYTACATVVSVAMWVVTLLFGLLNWLLQPEGLSQPVAWSILVTASVGFWLVFYRYFSRTEASR
jgi:hypothetical protein